MLLLLARGSRRHPKGHVNTKLVFMDDNAPRFKDSIWTPSPEPMSFADAFPVLVTTTGSLAALNRDIEKHGGEAVPTARFRPNVVER